jgi:hypothetical protein
MKSRVKILSGISLLSLLPAWVMGELKNVVGVLGS